MRSAARSHISDANSRSSLQVYMLGMVEFEAALALQRRLVYEVAGQRTTAALILCEHPPIITIGREGSWRQVTGEPRELRTRGWPVRWVNRGGGAWLQAPGQLAIYPVLALDARGDGLQSYLVRLQQVLVQVLRDFSIRAETRLDEAGVWVGARPIAATGVAVRNWVSYYGAILNVNPDLELFQAVRVGRTGTGRMTSLERERHGPLRPALVRERLLEYFVSAFQLDSPALFFEHPMLRRKARPDAVAATS